MDFSSEETDDQLEDSVDYDELLAEVWESSLDDSDADLWEAHYDTAVPDVDGE